MANSSERIPSLDGLRTVSILLVIAGHMSALYNFHYLDGIGNLGVRVFFVISGFLITGLLVKEVDRTATIDLLKFYFRRTLRIFPPYYFYLAALAAASFAGLLYMKLGPFLTASLYATDYINPVIWSLGHTWSLSVEEQFYLLLPGVLLLFGLHRAKLLLIVIVAVLPFVRLVDFQFSGADQFWVVKGFHANMDALAVGCLLSLFRNSLHKNAVYGRLLTSPAVALLPLIILFFNFQEDHPRFYLGVSISVMNVAIGFGIDWAVTNNGSLAGKLLNSAPMVTLGAMSYSIYLWQQPFTDPASNAIWTRFPFNIIGIVVMTLISYYVVEKRSLALRRLWETKLFGAKKPAAADELELARSAG